MSQGLLSLFSKLPPNLDPRFGLRKPGTGVWVVNDAGPPSLQPYYDFQIFYQASKLCVCIGGRDYVWFYQLWCFRIEVPGNRRASHIFGTDHYFSFFMPYTLSNTFKPNNSVESSFTPYHCLIIVHIFLIKMQALWGVDHTSFILCCPKCFS